MTNKEYTVLDVIGASRLREALNQFSKNGWKPIFPHVVYEHRNEIHFTISMERHTH